MTMTVLVLVEQHHFQFVSLHSLFEKYFTLTNDVLFPRFISVFLVEASECSFQGQKKEIKCMRSASSCLAIA